MTREEALAELEQPLYPAGELRTDKEFVLKKLGLSETEFAEIMKLPRREHRDFKTDAHFRRSYMKLLERTAPIRTAMKKVIPK